METLSPLIRILFPDFCALCNTYGCVLCNQCVTKLPRNKRFINQFCVAGLSYRDETVRSIILSLKKRNNNELAATLSHTMYESILEQIADLEILHNFKDPVIIPVPPSIDRMYVYGHNQAELLAQSLTDLLSDMNPTLQINIFSKRKTLVKQAKTKSRVQRFQNISKAFVIDTAYDASHKCFIIVDDIITTGATMHTLRELLLAAGARYVLCVAVAH